jgi:hypothetical protein
MRGKAAEVAATRFHWVPTRLVVGPGMDYSLLPPLTPQRRCKRESGRGGMKSVPAALVWAVVAAAGPPSNEWIFAGW